MLKNNYSIYDHVFRLKSENCKECGKPLIEWIPVMDAFTSVPEDFFEQYCEGDCEINE